MNISLSNWWSWGILLLLLMIVAVVDSRKRIPRKISIFILVPVLSVVIIFMMSENNKEAEQSFHTLEDRKGKERLSLLLCCGFERDRCFCDVYNGFCRKRSAYRCE